jgi:hypothetical protein
VVLQGEFEFRPHHLRHSPFPASNAPQAVAKDFNRDPTGDLPDIPNTELDNKLLEALQGVSTDKELKDFYQVGLWNYCEGDIQTNGDYKITHCSSRKANFWFNPVDVWELKNTTADELFPDKLQDGLNAYQKASKWMFTAFVIAICLTIAEFIIGIFAIFSRWGSLATTIVSTVRCLYIAFLLDSKLMTIPGPNRLHARRSYLVHRHLRYPRRCFRVRPQAI